MTDPASPSDETAFTPLYRRMVLAILLVAVFLSGFAALLYQVIWQRMLLLFTGSDVNSASLVIVAYLAGIGFGGMMGMRFADRLHSQSALRLSAFADILIAGFAWLSPWLFNDVLYSASVGKAYGLFALWFQLFGALFFPTFLMGFVFPVLSRVAASCSLDVPFSVGLVNGINILGAAAGCLVGTFVLAPKLGFEAALQFGSFASVASAIVLWGLSWIHCIQRPANAMVSAASAGDAPPRNPLRLIALLFFVIGFVAISVEIYTFRIISVVVGSSVHVYAIILAWFLLMDGLGSVLGSRLKPKHPIFLIWLFLCVIAIYPLAYSRVFSGYLGGSGLIWVPLLGLGLSAFLVGVAYPVGQRVIQIERHLVGYKVGLVQVANIFGNVLAGLLSGIVIMNWFGTAFLFTLNVAICLVLAWMLRAVFAGRYMKPAVLVIAISLAGALWVMPSNSAFWPPLHRHSGEGFFTVAEDASGVAAIERLPDGSANLLVDGQRQFGIPFGSYHVFLGMLPSAVHEKPDDALVIGLGGGATAYGAGYMARHVSVVELVRPEFVVHEAYLRQHPYEGAKEIFNEERFAFYKTDGRRFLASSVKKYDIIQADALLPVRSGSGFLYSMEYFQLIKSRLKPGGIMVQWAPTQRVIDTFATVFPYVVLVGEKTLVGSESAAAVSFDEAFLHQQWSDPDAIAYLDNAKVHREDFYRFSSPVARIRWGNPVDYPDLNHDWWPKDEYGVPSGRKQEVPGDAP